jgi:acyl-CoA synthetase (NDP forming)
MPSSGGDVARPHLADVLAPGRIAIVGASRNPRSLAARYLDHLLKHRFPGEVVPVNRGADEVRGIPAVPSLEAVEGPIDCALITVPERAAAAAAIAAAELEVPLVVMFTSGFGETGEEGRARQAELSAAFAASPSRLLGPNCPGFVNATAGIGASVNAFVGGHEIPAGGVGIVAQSGAVGGLIAERVLDRGAGISQIVFTGNEADVEVGEAIEAVAMAEETRAVACFVEGFTDPDRALAGVERATAAGTPVLVLPVGRSDAGRRAASLHTGKLLAVGQAERAALRQAGAILVEELTDLAEVAVGLATGPRRSGGRRVGIVSTTGGLGALLADQVREAGFELPPTAASVRDSLTEVLPAYASTENPCDLADALTTVDDLLQRAVGAFAASGEYDALLMTMAVHPPYLSTALSEDMVEAAAGIDLPLALIWPGGSMGTEAVAGARRGGVPVVESTRSCAALLEAWEVVAGGEPSPRREPDPLPRVEGAGERELKLALQGAGLRAPAGAVVRSAAEAEAAFGELGPSAVMKVHQPSVDHKASLGLVRRGIVEPAGAGTAWRDFESAARAAGFELGAALIEHQEQDLGIELLVSARRSPLGLELLVGPGGSTAELAAPRAVRLSPLAAGEADAIAAEVGVPDADRAALGTALVAVQRLALAYGEELEVLEVNPVLLAPGGPVALDAKLRLAAASR